MFSSHTISTYSVNTPVFNGPLDLLLHLIEREELDITKLSLAKVTDQYLRYIQNLPQAEPDQVSAFLVIASRLLQIKSELLLPRQATREAGEEDIGDALARQLLVYKRFKELAQHLAFREVNNLRTYPRLAPPPQFEGTLDLSGLTVEELLLAAQLAFNQQEIPLDLTSVITVPKITIREKISWIMGYLRVHRVGTFHQLLPRQAVRLDVVITFLAVLELVKRRTIQARQAGLFEDIEIEPSEHWGETFAFDGDFLV
jgi:segregation and condensation protein A